MVRVTISFRVIKQASLHCKLLVARKTLQLHIFPEMTICAVNGCLNSDFKLKSWKAQDCVIHVRVLHGPGLGPRAGPARSPWAGPGLNDILRAGPCAGLKLTGPGRARASK